MTEQTVCRDLDDVTVVIKTFEREDSLRAMLQSMRLFYPTIRAIIIDDSKIQLDRDSFDEYTTYIHTEYDIGLSDGRNRGVELAQTEFVFIIDDDFIFTEHSRLDLLRMPVASGGFAIAGSRMFNFGHREVTFHGSMEVDDGTLRLLMEQHKGSHAGFPVFDFCLNLLMSRRDFLLENRWSPELKMREHWDFFLRIKKTQSGLVTMRHDTSFLHFPHRPTHYAPLRRERNTEVYAKMALDKNGISRVEKVPSFRAKLEAEYLRKQMSLRRLFGQRG